MAWGVPLRQVYPLLLEHLPRPSEILGRMSQKILAPYQHLPTSKNIRGQPFYSKRNRLMSGGDRDFPWWRGCSAATQCSHTTCRGLQNCTLEGLILPSVNYIYIKILKGPNK